MRAWHAADGPLTPPLAAAAGCSERPWLGFPFHFDPSAGPDGCAGYATRKDPRRTRPRTLWDDESSMEKLIRAAGRERRKNSLAAERQRE
jgi:hypothetical protein